MNRCLAHCSASRVKTSDRPFGTFPQRVEDDHGEFKRAQELLIEFGDLMVEKGLLSP